jgi:DNA-directed RNA polymerase specialized sigma24 family protein
MSRQRKQAYRSRELADLTRQLLYAPPEKRVELVRQAEQLHDELDPQKNYPIDFVVYRLTTRRVPPSESVMLVGEAIQPDLRLLIDTLSRSVQMPDDETDPGSTSRELADVLGVSTKTITRWRDAGLRWRWGVRGDKHMVLITRSALDAFVKKHPDRVSSASAFQRFSDQEKEQLIERSRRLARAADEPPQVILRHLAKRSGRSVEALRQLTHRHDEANPDNQIFADRTAPLTTEQKAQIDQAYQHGATVSALCERFGKTRSTIYRAIHEARAKQIENMTIEAVFSPVFERDDADEVLMQPISRQGKPRQLGPEVIGAVPDALQSVYDRPIEPDDAVRSLVVRYNYLKYRAGLLRHQIVSSTPKANEMDEFDHLLGRIKQARGDAIAAVLPVALSVVRRQQTGSVRENEASLLRLLYIAHGVMIETIDRYDASVAHSLESVLTNRLIQVLAKPVTSAQAISAKDLRDQLGDAGVVIERG